MTSRYLKINIIIFISVMFSLLLAAVGNAEAATYYVSPTGSPTAACDISHPCTFATAHGKTDVTEIQARGGRYTSQFWRISKANLTLKAYPGETPLLDGEFIQPVADYTGLIDIEAGGVTVDGIHAVRSRFTGIDCNHNKAINVHIKNCNVGYCFQPCVHTGRANVTHNNLFENSIFEWGNYDVDYKGGGSIVSVVKLMGGGTVLRGCTVRYGSRSGAEDYLGVNSVIEGCQIYGNAWTQVHAAATETMVMRNNIIYGTDRPEPIYAKVATWPYSNSGQDLRKGYGDGLAMMVEHWYDGTNWDSGHRAYNNLIANTQRGIVLGFNYGAGCNPTNNEGCYPNNDISGCLFYNNTIINPNRTKTSVVGAGSCVTVDNLEGSIGSGNIFRNNLFFQSDAGADIIYRRNSTFTPAQVSFNYNLWSKAPSSDLFKGSNDPTAPSYLELAIANYFTKTSGWNNLIAGSLSAGNFKLLPTATNAINKGTALSTEYNRDYWNTLRPQGASWDIGAHEYASNDTQAPASPSGLSVR